MRHIGGIVIKEDCMGNQLVWEDRFNIGVKFIDKEHQKLFGITLFPYTTLFRSGQEALGLSGRDQIF